MLMNRNLCGKKILLISNMYPSKRFPHYGVFVKNTEDMLKNNGLSVDCVAIHKQTGAMGKLWAYLRFHIETILHVLLRRYTCVYAHYISHTAFVLLLIKKIRPHLKIVVNVHGNDIVPEDKHDEKYLPLVYKVKGSVDRWIVPSEYFKKILEKNYGIIAERITVYPSGGIDCKQFSRKDTAVYKEEAGLARDDFVAGFVGRIEKNKGWDTMLEAAALARGRIPELKCLIVGAGSLESELEQLIQEKRIRDLIVRIPLVSQERLSAFYSAMDVFCLPSYRKSESLALAGLEAMACGCIVTGSNMAGPATYIRQGKNGFLFEPRNAQELAEKLIEIYHMPEADKERIRIQAEETARDYDKEKVKEILLDVFRNL